MWSQVLRCANSSLFVMQLTTQMASQTWQQSSHWLMVAPRASRAMHVSSFLASHHALNAPCGFSHHKSSSHSVHLLKHPGLHSFQIVQAVTPAYLTWCLTCVTCIWLWDCFCTGNSDLIMSFAWLCHHVCFAVLFCAVQHNALSHVYMFYVNTMPQ